jgi:hypothetical protein
MGVGVEGGERDSWSWSWSLGSGCSASGFLTDASLATGEASWTDFEAVGEAIWTGTVCAAKFSGVEKGRFLGLRERDFAGLERADAMPPR